MRPRRSPLLRLGLVLLVPLLVVPALLMGVVAVRVCAEPIDMSSVRQRVERRLDRLRGEPAPRPTAPAYVEASALSISLPHGETLEELVEDVLRSDVAKYWFHTILGRSLQVARCEPAASAVQWLKAAAHARTPRQVERSAAGLARDVARSRPPEATRAVVCEWVRAGVSPTQAAVLARASVRCGSP